MNWHKNNFRLTDNNHEADIDYIHRMLNTTYWAENRTRATVEKSVRNSVMFTLFDGKTPVGFTRIVTDHATFCWLCDVFIDPAYRGKGLGKWLMECLMEHPSTDVRINLLATRDAHGLYEKYGYVPKECMIIRKEKN